MTARKGVLMVSYGLILPTALAASVGIFFAVKALARWAR